MTDRDTNGSELIDRDALTRWLAATVGGEGPVALERIGEDTGVANTLYRVHWAGARFVLRRPPESRVTASAGNIGRERVILAALAPTSVRHPRLVAWCDDPSVAGAPFLLMDHVDGFTAVDPLPESFASDVDARRGFGLEAVDALAELATADWRSIGLASFGKPDGFLARQVDRWLWQLGTYATRPLPHVDELTDWLRTELPAPGPIGILHGDYSLFNVMFAPGVPARLAAIVDWDTATIGEPLMDLGHLLSRWDEPGEEPTSLGHRDIDDRSGLASRAELADRFASITGWDLSSLRYYQVVALFKLGCIMEGHHALEVQRGDQEHRFATTAPELFRDARRIARGGRP
jgi:aminoglycoside phosphotransferase (APT) family kinase protein